MLQSTDEGGQRARRSSIKTGRAKHKCRMLTPIKVECIENDLPSESFISPLSSGDSDSTFGLDPLSGYGRNTQDYIRLKNLTQEKMVLTKRISRKQARKERLAQLNSRIHLAPSTAKDCFTSLSVHQSKSL